MREGKARGAERGKGASSRAQKRKARKSRSAKAQGCKHKAQARGNNEANKLVTLFWCSVTDKEGDPWFERVPSKANLSDAISRGDEEEARRQGWTKLEVDLRSIWAILMKLTKVGFEHIPALAKLICVAAKVQTVPQHLD